MMKKYLLSSVYSDKENEGGTPEEIAARAAAAGGERENVFQERIGELTRKRGEAERATAAAVARAEKAETDLATAQALLEAGKKPDGEKEPVTRTVIREPTIEELLERPEVKKRINDAAAARVEAGDITAQGDALYDKGAEEYSTERWDKALKVFSAFDGLREDVTKALLAVPNGHRVLFHLGNNPAEIGRIYKLAEKNPVAMAVEITKLAAKVPAPKKLSDAPEPPDNSDGGRAGGSKTDYTNPDVSMADFVAQRDADLKKRGVRL